MRLTIHFDTITKVKIESVWVLSLKFVLITIICIDVWREVGCLLTLNIIYQKNCCEYIWDGMKEYQKWGLISIKDSWSFFK